MTEPRCFLDPFKDCLFGILHGLGSSVSVRHAAGQVRHPRQISTPFILGEEADFNSVGGDVCHARSSRILLIKPTRALM